MGVPDCLGELAKVRFYICIGVLYLKIATDDKEIHTIPAIDLT